MRVCILSTSSFSAARSNWGSSRSMWSVDLDLDLDRANRSPFVAMAPRASLDFSIPGSGVACLDAEFCYSAWIVHGVL